MQVNVVHTDSLGAMDMLLFPEQNPMNRIYLEQQLNRFSDTLTDFGRSFIETSKDLYQKANDSSVIRMAKAALRAAKGVIHPNTITYIDDLQGLQTAQSMMQRFIMAEPVIREYYHQQKCDGYSDTYVDMDPGKIGPAHYDYRRVMTGMIQDTVNDKGEYDWKAVNYYEDLRDGDRELDFFEKTSVLKTWNVMNLFTSNDQDPTNLFGGNLGV